MEKKIFNMTRQQIKNLSGTRDDKCDYNTPIGESNETLEPCIRGANKILSNPKEKDMMYRIYRGVRSSEQQMGKH